VLLCIFEWNVYLPAATNAIGHKTSYLFTVRTMFYTVLHLFANPTLCWVQVFHRINLDSYIYWMTGVPDDNGKSFNF